MALRGTGVGRCLTTGFSGGFELLSVVVALRENETVLGESANVAAANDSPSVSAQPVAYTVVPRATTHTARIAVSFPDLLDRFMSVRSERIVFYVRTRTSSLIRFSCKTATAHDDTERDNDNAYSHHEDAVPFDGKPQKREDCDKC